MSKERVNIRMDGDIFNFFENMAQEKNISRSEAMVLALKEYKEAREEREIIDRALESLEEMDEDFLDSIQAKDSMKIRELLEKLSSQPGNCSGKGRARMQEDIERLDLLLNILPEENTQDASKLLDGLSQLSEEDLKLARSLTESLGDYNDFLQTISVPIEIINKKFNYHNNSIHYLRDAADSIISHMGLRSKFIDPNSLNFIHQGRRFKNLAAKEERMASLKEEIKKELKEELLKELDK